MSVISGIFQADAVGDAADTGAEASRDASAAQLQMFREQQASMEPWRASGVNALNQLNAMMGLPQYQAPTNALVPGGAAPAPPVRPTMNTAGYGSDWINPDNAGNPSVGPTAAMEKYNQDYAEYVRQMAEYNAKGGGRVQDISLGRPVREGGAWQPRTQPTQQPQDWRSLMDPGYEFRKQEGINALAAAGAASGNYGSGNMGVALQDYGQNIASQEFQNVYNRLAGMSGTGQVTSQQIGSMGVNTGGAMANYLNQAGQNIAQGQIAGANALAGGARDLEQGIASYYMYKQPAADYISQSEFDALWY